MSGLKRDRTAEPVSRDEILRRERATFSVFPIFSLQKEGLATIPVDAQYAERDNLTYVHDVVSRAPTCAGNYYRRACLDFKL